MRRDFPETAPLVCPACRARTAEGWNLHTLAIADVVAESGGEIIQGVLACRNPGCGKRYPVVAGIPLVGSPLAVVALAEPEVDPALAGVLVGDEPDDRSLPQLFEHLSIYLDTEWGDRATPPLDGWGFRALAELVRRWCPRGRTVELGCAVGRALAEVPGGPRVGVDRHFAALRRARRLLAGERVAYARRLLGRSYGRAEIAGLEAPADLVCGDVLDPPLAPGAFEVVLALNVVDVVADPGRLVDVAAGLVAPGGELVLTAPFAWQSGAVDEDKRLVGPDPERLVAERLAGHGLEVVDQTDVDWVLRRDARSSVAYRVHALRARRR